MFLWFNRWSIDVALGASLAYAWLTHYYHRETSWVAVFAMFFAVLAWYHLDHLIDSYALKAITLRRQFYVFHRKTLQASVFVNCLIAFVLSFFLPFELLWKGWMLVGVMVGYFLFVFLCKKQFFFKELSVALIYSVAVHIHVIEEDLLSVGRTIIAYFLLAFSNLLLFDYFEQLEEKKVAGERTEKWFYGTLLVQGGVALLAFFQSPVILLRQLAHTSFLMAHLSFLIFWHQKLFFLNGEKFRFMSDGIFVALPILGLCFSIVL